ncbi:hypothetical protein [Sphingobacterium yanglingense]|uniref:Uncharacterized protein n=1 Tax=Sphingobacterium yanglingense TaxID=1437280 RepID=A0A4R6WRR8_9SPHI|nr:hypothetical protein [Sphingobacterium yanglingense]TDQ79336.1 hypothetical protein CLV99_0772 [Sphingobacterium yanglingense]
MKRTTISKIFFTALTLFLFFSCKKFDDNKFVGYWVIAGDDYSEVIEIKQIDSLYYVKNRGFELPAEFDKANTKLTSALVVESDSVPILLALSEDPKNMTLHTEKHVLNYVKINRAEAEKQEKKVDEYCNPDFFIGHWERVDMEGGHEIKKEGEIYYYVTNRYTKKMSYNAFNHILSCDLGVGMLTFQRSGDNEIKAFGLNTYRKVSP